MCGKKPRTPGVARKGMMVFMKAAIYARKSKVTEKGDSIENQVKLCREYLSHLAVDEIYIYKDEGFSGKNTHRPEFLKMLEDAKNKKFSMLICYKLDRISRNVADFSALASDLENLSISFISVNEQFDTSSAMGRAMMYIASVFSQLERETISSRVKDNMYSLAESGKWLGGTTPTGYKAERIKLKDPSGVNRTFCILVPIPEEVAIINLIYEKYLEFKSINKVEKYLLKADIKTKKNKNWSSNSIGSVLTNPVYVKADKKVVEHLKTRGLKINGKVDSLHGILTYKKRKGKSGSRRVKDTCQWIASVSFHEGIISSSKWLQVQEILASNKAKAPALGSSSEALLTGIINCSHCGSPMRVTYGKKYGDNQKKYYYVCTLKNKWGKTNCNSKNINGLDLDKIIIENLKELTLDKTTIIEELNNYKNQVENSNENMVLKKLNTSLLENNKAIDNLLNNLSLTSDEETVKMILSKVNELKLKNKALQGKIYQLQVEDIEKEIDLDKVHAINLELSSVPNTLTHLSPLEKRRLIQSVVHKIYANGTTGDVLIKLKGVETM